MTIIQKKAPSLPVKQTQGSHVRKKMIHEKEVNRENYRWQNVWKVVGLVLN